MNSGHSHALEEASRPPQTQTIFWGMSQHLVELLKIISLKYKNIISWLPHLNIARNCSWISKSNSLWVNTWTLLKYIAISLTVFQDWPGKFLLLKGNVVCQSQVLYSFEVICCAVESAILETWKHSYWLM